MAVKHSPVKLCAKQMEELAKELGSPLMMKAADRQYLKEQRLMEHRIGKMTLKVVEGVFYQLRPHGWIKLSGLSDIVFEDVRPLPINERIQSLYSCRAEVEGEVHTFNVSFPMRSDLPQVIQDERIARGIALTFGAKVVDVWIKRRDGIIQFQVVNGDDVYSMSDPKTVDVGGSTTINLEV